MKPSSLILLPFAAIASAQLNALPRQYDDKALVRRQAPARPPQVAAATGAGKSNATAAATGAGAAKATASGKASGAGGGSNSGAKATGAGGAAAAKSTSAAATGTSPTASSASSGGTVSTSGADGAVRFDALGSGLVTVAGVALGLAVWV